MAARATAMRNVRTLRASRYRVSTRLARLTTMLVPTVIFAGRTRLTAGPRNGVDRVTIASATSGTALATSTVVPTRGGRTLGRPLRKSSVASTGASAIWEARYLSTVRSRARSTRWTRGTSTGPVSATVRP